MEAPVGSLAAITARNGIPASYEYVATIAEVVTTHVMQEEEVSFAHSVRADLILLRKRGTGLPVVLLREHPTLFATPGSCRDIYIPADALLELKAL